jgi:phage terminase large subunit-like protein
VDPRDPVAFIDRFITRDEHGCPFQLFLHQRTFLQAAFQFEPDGELTCNTITYGATKKSGKSTTNGIVTLWWAFTQEAPNEILIIANDLEQATSRVFQTLKGLLRHNPELGCCAKVQAKLITLTNGTTIRPIASEYAGAAGSNHGFTSWDDLWAYTSERSWRLWEELTPVPTRRNSVRFITTSAGFLNESALLLNLYRQGVGLDEHVEGQGVRVDTNLPIYLNHAARQLTMWDWS